MEFVGDFETHVTVASDPTRWSALVDWAAANDVKVTHIVLDRGRIHSQPMLTYTGSGTSSDEIARAHQFAARLTDAGFPVVRVKVEAEPNALGVPADDKAAIRFEPHFHFEHHVKVRLPDGERRQLIDLVLPHRAHVSRNARRVLAGGTQEVFVTQRCFHVGLGRATGRLCRLVEALNRADVEILSTEQEFVIFDSNLAADDGWLPTNGETR